MKLENIPENIIKIEKKLEKEGFQVFLVGGCVRDLLLGKKPKDWDLATDATPEQIQELFEKTFYENQFGTVGIVNEDEEDETLKIIEVTPFRKETGYSNKRHPDKVEFGQNLEDDLKRRDFTINALAYNISKGHLKDISKGHQDIKDMSVRAVGNPEERFEEDALRMFRAVRLAAELGFEIEKETGQAIKNKAFNIKDISAERIRDEFIKIIKSDNPGFGIRKTEELGLLQYFLPELKESIKIMQNSDHIYDVWTHLIKALEHAANKNWSFHVRLSALFHDIGKPKTRRWDKTKKDYTFYGHEVVGAKMTKNIMKRLKFPKKDTEKITTLVRNHMFFSDIDQITLSAVRRIVRNVGEENIWDLVKIRMCDRIGMGRPKEEPYRLRKYESMIEEAMRSPISVGKLAIDGNILMKKLPVKPGPRIGWMLHALLNDVLEDPKLNDEEKLLEKARELNQFEDQELKKLGEKGKKKTKEEENKELEEIRKKYKVK